MSGLLCRFCCILAFFVVIFCPSMSVYITSPDSVWALRPRGKPPPCSPELRSRLASLGLWNPTRFIYTSSGWRVVSRRGCRAGRRIQRQRVTSPPVSLSTSPSHHTTFACLNVRSPNNKLDSVLEITRDRSIDIFLRNRVVARRGQCLSRSSTISWLQRR